jgi:hypothetical protein
MRPCPSRSMRMLKDGSCLCEDCRIGVPVFTIFFRETYYTKLVNAGTR